MLTQKDLAARTEAYASGKSYLIRDEILRHIMEEEGAPIPRSFRRETRNFQTFRQTITVTMNRLPEWRSIGTKACPRWERIE